MNTITVLVFESFSRHIDSDIAYYERAQRAIHPITSSVHSYLRSILTATFFAIFYSFYFICSRDFILSVEWYYAITVLVFESFSQHIDSDIAYYERAQRAIHPITSSVHSYLRSILTATFFAIFYSFHFICSRDFTLYILVLYDFSI